jgi:hypothetical protein
MSSTPNGRTVSKDVLCCVVIVIRNLFEINFQIEYLPLPLPLPYHNDRSSDRLQVLEDQRVTLT